MKRNKNKSLNKNLCLFTNGKYDIDKYIDFVTQFNEFMSHKMKPFEPIKGRNWKI